MIRFVRGVVLVAVGAVLGSCSDAGQERPNVRSQAQAVVIDTVTLDASGDVTIKAGAANGNFAGDVYLRVQKSGRNRALVMFDEAAIVAAVGSDTLVEARIELEVSDLSTQWGSGREVDIHALTVGWLEANATNNCAVDTVPTNGAADCGSGDPAGVEWDMHPNGTPPYVVTASDSILVENSTSGTMSFDITGDIAAMLAGGDYFGHLIRKREEGQNGRIEWHSRETAFGPRLVLTIERPDPDAGGDAGTDTGDAGDTDPDPVVVDISALGDSSVRQGSPHAAFGDDSILRLQSSGKNRALVQFDPALLVTPSGAGALQSATLELPIDYTASNWGTGRTIAVHRMTESWTEDGATWNCSEDSDTSDSTDSDCVGVLWEMFGGSAPPYELAYTDTAIITSDQTGTVTFDVTTDVAAAIDAGLGEFSFLIKKTNEGENGRIEFASLETGNGPSLVLTFDGEAGDTGTDAGGDAGDAGDASDADTDTGSGGAQGQPCDTDADCSGGLCITEALAGAPDGFCSQLCDVLLQDCPAGAVCAPAPFGDVCLSECVDSGDCRAGYHCVAYPGSANICEPACTDDAQCTQVGNCNDDTGFCSSLVEECFDGVDNDGDSLVDCHDADCDGVNDENACGGCSDLPNEPGDPCGFCNLDQYVCDGTDAVICDGDTFCPYELCDNGIDDDGDSLVDCDDPLCAGDGACNEIVCDDGLDSDIDGFVDCDDPDCSPDPVCDNIPPAPEAVAPPLDRDITTTVIARTEYYFTGSDPIQQGVAPGTIDPARTVVISGRVLDTAEEGLPGVRVEIAGRPEFGHTFTRSDGAYDLVANGGGRRVVRISRDGYVSGFRVVETNTQSYRHADDIILRPLDAATTAVQLAATTTTITAQGTPQTDVDGTRTAAVMFPGDVTATMRMPDGTTSPLPTLTFRATELTVGDNVIANMPASLPPLSAYTYAVEYSADEAIAAGATSVEFSEPVSSYVDNFLALPVGSEVPLGYYDEDLTQWVPADNGVVIEIVSVTAGLADIDTDGDGIADDALTLASWGIDAEEQEQLALLYNPGDELWRHELDHFSVWDKNLGMSPPADAEAPDGEPTVADNMSLAPESPFICASVIEAQSQILRESVDIVGVPWHLWYSTSRVPGRVAENAVTIPFVTPSTPASVYDIRVSLDIAGEGETHYWGGPGGPSIPAVPSELEYVWPNARRLQGRQPLNVTIEYRYLAVYEESERFGYRGNGQVITTSTTPGIGRGSPLLGFERRYQLAVGTSDARPQGIAGWTPSIHHHYDTYGRVLHFGDGSRRAAEATGAVLQTAVSLAPNVFSPSDRVDMAVDPEGRVYYNTPHQIFRVEDDGTTTLIAGTGVQGGSGDGGPATSARLRNIRGISFGSDGSLYFGQGGSVVRRIRPDGIIERFAGTYQVVGPTGDGGLAIDALLGGVEAIGVGPDDTVYIGEQRSGFATRFIRAVDPSGIITTIAGAETGNAAGPDGVPATATRIQPLVDIEVDADGQIYFAQTAANDALKRIRMIDQNGDVSRIAGGGGDVSTDNIPATSRRFEVLETFALTPDGRVIVASWDTTTSTRANAKIEVIEHNGLLARIAGGSAGCWTQTSNTPRCSEDTSGQFAFDARLGALRAVTMTNDGVIHFVDSDGARISRIEPLVEGFTGSGDIGIASADGSEYYVFTSGGRHLRTLDAIVGNTIWEFGYDSEGYLIHVDDRVGNRTTIHRDSQHLPTAIEGPFGSTTVLTTDGDGYLSTITNPMAALGAPGAETWTASYLSGGGGLLETLTDPRGNTWLWEYDVYGRMEREYDPEIGTIPGTSTPFIELSRTELGDGQIQIDAQTAACPAATHVVTFDPDGAYERTTENRDGTFTTIARTEDQERSVVTPDGTEIESRVSPDPRFGMQAPVIESTTTTLPSTLTSTTTSTRRAPGASESDPLAHTAVTETVTTNGRVFTTTYDVASRTFTSTSAEGLVSTLVVDAEGRPVTADGPATVPTTMSYDPTTGRLASASSTGASQTRSASYTYDSRGFVESTTNSLSETTMYSRDDAGRVTSIELADSEDIGFSYDGNGNLSSLTPPGQPAHNFTQNDVNLESSYDAPDAGTSTGVTTTTYTDFRAPELVTMPDGSTFSYTYDAEQRVILVEVDDASEPATVDQFRAPVYDASTGQVVAIDAEGGESIAYAYDGFLMTSATTTGAVSASVEFGYDRGGGDFDGVVSSLSVNGLNPVAFTYDSDLALISAGDLTITRDATTRLPTQTDLGLVRSAMTYDPDFADVTGLSYRFDPAGVDDELYDADFTYDALGRIASMAETVAGDTTLYEYTYHEVGQLTDVDVDAVPTYHYEYDPNGNRTLAHDERDFDIVAGYDAQDRIEYAGATMYTFDDNGYLAESDDGLVLREYDYDLFGNLREVVITPDVGAPVVVEYLIDAANRRVGRIEDGVVTNRWHYQDGLNPVAELDALGNVTRRWVYGSRRHAPDYMIEYGAGGSETVFRYVTDVRGSVRAVVNAVSGTAVQEVDYDPYGRVLRDTAPGWQPFGYAGGIYDAETGLVRFGARDYDAEIGRWTAKDPIGFRGGDTGLYAYVGGDPIGAIDPTGLAEGCRSEPLPDCTEICRDRVPDAKPYVTCVREEMTGLRADGRRSHRDFDTCMEAERAAQAEHNEPCDMCLDRLRRMILVDECELPESDQPGDPPGYSAPVCR